VAQPASSWQLHHLDTRQGTNGPINISEKDQLTLLDGVLIGDVLDKNMERFVATVNNFTPTTQAELTMWQSLAGFVASTSAYLVKSAVSGAVGTSINAAVRSTTGIDVSGISQAVIMHRMGAGSIANIIMVISGHALPRMIRMLTSGQRALAAEDRLSGRIPMTESGSPDDDRPLSSAQIDAIIIVTQD
jgi:hypothetical protein